MATVETAVRLDVDSTVKVKQPYQMPQVINLNNEVKQDDAMLAQFSKAIESRVDMMENEWKSLLKASAIRMMTFEKVQE